MAETDPFCMTYTGGTTGRPKGVLCSHRARDVTAHTVAFEEALDERDVVAIVTPLFHVAALNIMFQPAILVGATCVFVTRWSADGLHGNYRNQVTATFMVPTQVNQLVRIRTSTRSSSRPGARCRSPARRCPIGCRRRLKAKLPHMMVTQIYGQSEMGVLTVLRDWYLPAKLGSVGRQAYNVDVAVLICKGARWVRRDRRDREARRQSDAGVLQRAGADRGLLQARQRVGLTGDVGIMDDEGFVTLVDRAKDMMISGGENVYPKEIEDVLYQLGRSPNARCSAFRTTRR